MEHFVAGTTARTVSKFCGVNRKTAAFYFHRLCEIIAVELGAENGVMLGGEIEVDESYFGGKRKGKRGRRAGSLSLVQTIRQRNRTDWWCVPGPGRTGAQPYSSGPEGSRHQRGECGGCLSSHAGSTDRALLGRD